MKIRKVRKAVCVCEYACGYASALLAQVRSNVYGMCAKVFAMSFIVASEHHVHAPTTTITHREIHWHAKREARTHTHTHTDSTHICYTDRHAHTRKQRQRGGGGGTIHADMTGHRHTKLDDKHKHMSTRIWRGRTWLRPLNTSHSQEQPNTYMQIPTHRKRAQLIGAFSRPHLI
jgi:hypothetical protein